MKRILAIWLPNWPVQRLVADRPERSGRAVVLSERDPRYGDRVRACCATAAAAGVRPRMPLAEARSLLPPAARIERHDPHGDREALTKLAQWCERFSPLVGVDEAEQPDGLLLDVTGVAGLFGGEASLLQQVAAAFEQLEFEVRVAVADTLLAAWAFARFRSGALQSRAVESEIPTNTHGSGEPCYYDLPIAALRLPERTAERLQRLGLFQVGQLAALPRASLGQRFGAELLTRLDQIAGLAPTTIAAHQPPETPEAQWLLEYPTTRRDAIEHILLTLFQRIARQLRDQGCGALRLDCRLACGEGRACLLRVGLYQPSGDAQHWLGLAQMQLELLSLPAAVEAVHVVAEATAPCERRQAELFDTAARDDPSKLALFIERLSSRLGREQVVRPQLQAEAQVELAYGTVPLTGGVEGQRGKAAEGQRGRGGRQKVADTLCGSESPTERAGYFAGNFPESRPLRIFQPPEPVAVVALAGDGPPTMFHYRRQRYRVARSFGPERIETGWWRGDSARRDYYRIETDTGSRWWLFQRLQDEQWFLHGEFV